MLVRGKDVKDIFAFTSDWSIAAGVCLSFQHPMWRQHTEVNNKLPHRMSCYRSMIGDYLI